MRTTNFIHILITFTLIYVFTIIQFFITPFTSDTNIKLYFLHVFFYCAIFSVNYPTMLLLALLVGFTWDLLTLPIINFSLETQSVIQINSYPAENIIGYSILIFGIVGALFHSFHSIYLSKKWYLSLLLIILAFLIHFFLEYILLIFIRGNIITKNQFFNDILRYTLINCIIISPIFILLKYIYNIFYKNTYKN